MPTVGRVVLYWPPAEHDRPDIRHAATIASVLGENLVNLAVADHNGVMYSVQNAVLTDCDDECKPGHCEWMEYQKGQAEKHSEDIPPISETVGETDIDDVVTGDDLPDVPEDTEPKEK